MTMMEVLGKVTREMREMKDPCWIDARKRILELFGENGIPETEYKGFMANNVLPELLLK